MPWITNEVKCSCGKQHDLFFDDWADGTTVYTYICPERKKRVAFRAFVAAEEVETPPEGSIKVEPLG